MCSAKKITREKTKKTFFKKTLVFLGNMPKDTRRKITNPKTGRKVYMTGVKGREIREGLKKKKITKAKCSSGKCKIIKATSGKAKNERKKQEGKAFYGFPGAVKTDKAYKCTKNGVCRPSARFNYNNNNLKDVYYDGKWHYMGFTSDGSPKYYAYSR